MPQDIVAGRSAAQIETAKRRAVGGKRKRCTKGKSCSATCIAASKICLVEIPWVAAKGIGPVRDKLLKTVKPPERQTSLTSSISLRPTDSPSIGAEKKDFNALVKAAKAQLEGGKLNADTKQYLKDLISAKKKVLKNLDSPAERGWRKAMEKEGPEFKDLNTKLRGAERMVQIYRELGSIYRERLKNETAGSPAYNKIKKQLDDARGLRRTYENEADKYEKAKAALKAQIAKSPTKAPSGAPKPKAVTYQNLSNYGKIAIEKVQQNLDAVNRATKAIAVKGAEFAGNINWNAIAESGARRLGQPGAYGAFVTVPVANLFKFGIKGDYPKGVGVKGGKIGINEASIIKKVGEAGLGPRLVAAKLSSNLDGSKKVHLNGLLAMSKVSGKDFASFNSPQDKVNGVEIASAFWKARKELHQIGVAHNDMHHANVLIDSRGKVKFVDFGLAQDNRKAALAEAIGAATGSDWQVNRWEKLGGKEAENFGFKGYRTAPEYDRIKRNWEDLKVQMQKDGLTSAEISSIGATGLRRDDSEYSQGAWKSPVLTDSRVAKYIDMLYEGV